MHSLHNSDDHNLRNMVYYKLILDKRRIKSDLLYPVIIRITHNKTNTTISTGIRIKEEHWDSNTQQVNKLHPNYQLINQSIATVYLKVQRAVHKLVDTGSFSFEALKNELSDKQKVVAITFNNFSQKVIQDMIAIKRTGNAIVYQTAVNRLINYCGNNNIKFSEIDYTFLEAFKHKLTLEGMKPNTVGNYFRSIRALYNKAIKAKLVNRSLYPFHDITIKQQKTAKRAIGIKEIKDITSMNLKPNSASWQARNYFMLSFCLIGISFTDLAYLKPANIIKGRLIFKRRKTHKQYDIKLTPQAQMLLDIFKRDGSTYLLSVLPSKIEEDTLVAKKIISQWIKTTNKYLKRIGEDIGLDSPLTTYVARHTWATTAKKMGYANELIAEAMGHEYGNKITGIYLDSFDEEIIDSLNEMVISSCYSLQ